MDKQRPHSPVDLVMREMKGAIYSTGDVLEPGTQQGHFFELKTAAHVMFNLGAGLHTYDSYQSAFQLHIQREGEAWRQVAETRNARGADNMTNYVRAVLFLPAGRYNWSAKFEAVGPASFHVFRMMWQIYECAPAIDFQLHGTWNLWTTISSQHERRVTARAAMEVHPGASGIAVCVLSKAGIEVGRTDENEGSPSAIARMDAIVLAPSVEYRVDAAFRLAHGDQRLTQLHLYE